MRVMGGRATAGLGLAVVLSALAAGCGSSDSQTASAAAVCKERLGKFRKALVELDDRMVGGLSYDDYEAKVSDLKVLSESVDLRALERESQECGAVAHMAFDAFFEFIDASDLWTDCWQNVACRTGETEQPLLFENWQRAGTSVAAMEARLRRMQQHPTNDTCPPGATMSDRGYCVAD
jgi:hypothetical protein